MKIEEIKIPHIGEGLQSVKVVKLCREEGEEILSDEILYEIETDKTIMAIESPISGIVKKWHANVDDEIEIDKTIVEIELKERDENIQKVITPPSIEKEDKLLKVVDSSSQEIDFFEEKLTKSQIELNNGFDRGRDKIVSAIGYSKFEWQKLLRIKELLAKDMIVKDSISDFLIFAYLISQTIRNIKKWCTILIDNYTKRTFNTLNLGFGVKDINGNLVTAVINGADLLSFAEFNSIYQKNLASAINGENQVHNRVQFILSYTGIDGLEFAIPTLVYPASAILFVGSPINKRGFLTSKLVLNFNHKLFDGMDAKDLFDQLETTYDNLMNGLDTKKDSSDAKSPSRYNSDELQEIINKEIEHMIGRKIDIKKTFGTQGFDSLKNTRLINILAEKFAHKLSPTIIWTYPTLEKLAIHLEQELNLKEDS